MEVLNDILGYKNRKIFKRKTRKIKKEGFRKI